MDLTGLDTLDGRDIGVGTRLVSPSGYTGGSWYSACAENPTRFLLDVEPPDAGEWALGGVWRLEAGGCRLDELSCPVRTSRSWIVSRGGVGGRGGSVCKTVDITAGDAIATEPGQLCT